MEITVWSLQFLGIQLLNDVCKSDLKKKGKIVEVVQTSLIVVKYELFFSACLQCCLHF